jgi:hypothetical protein
MLVKIAHPPDHQPCTGQLEDHKPKHSNRAVKNPAGKRNACEWRAGCIDPSVSLMAIAPSRLIPACNPGSLEVGSLFGNQDRRIKFESMATGAADVGG